MLEENINVSLASIAHNGVKTKEFCIGQDGHSHRDLFNKAYSITDHSTDLRAAVGVAAVTSLHSHSTSTKSSTGWSARSTSRSSSSEKLSSQVTYRSCERSGDR